MTQNLANLKSDIFGLIKCTLSDRVLYLLLAEVLLSGEINIKVTLAGFPTPVTSALSMANPRARDQYEHYIFSGRKYQSTACLLPLGKDSGTMLLCIIFLLVTSFAEWSEILCSLFLQHFSSASMFQVTCQHWSNLTHLQPSHPYSSSALLLWQHPLPHLLTMLTLLNQLRLTLSEFGCAVFRNILRCCSQISAFILSKHDCF